MAMNTSTIQLIAKRTEALPAMFACSHPGCDRHFNRKCALDEHAKTHTGEKPHVCPMRTCNKRFSTSGNLARHKRLHGFIEPLPCPVDGCVCTFASNNKLEKHMKFHFGSDDVKVCVVSGCGKTFSTTGNLNRHLKAAHGGSNDLVLVDGTDVDSTNNYRASTSAKCVVPVFSSVTGGATSHSPVTAVEWTSLQQQQQRPAGYFEPETTWTDAPLCSLSCTPFPPPVAAMSEESWNTDVIDVLIAIFDDQQQHQYQQHEASAASPLMTALVTCSVDIFQSNLHFGAPFTSYQSY